MEPSKCQIFCMNSMSDGLARDLHRSPYMDFRIWLARQLGPNRKRAIKKRIAYWLTFVSTLFGKRQASEPLVGSDLAAPHFAPGDRVRVRSREQIQATLGLFGDCKGLVIMPEMWRYCDTEQRIFKLVGRYVDERELRVRKATGIVLLEGLMCEGTQVFPCDRSCFFFWREEWLTKIE
ncbi:hypothetical protein [Aggregatilinea lenta]|uniref:hypothetical protein n=1 Tax=Aggregatilinea lenta TaxID=913108 RepID=UPI000E5A6298|nr:hypothetical protein [Aggregatilinea lenta]